MARPVKEYSLGKVKAAIFEGEYEGQKTYSVKFQKSYKDKSGNWKNTEYFSNTDLRDLGMLIITMMGKQVKERTPQANGEPQQNNGEAPW